MKADELWEKYSTSDWRVEMTKTDFLAALYEYGALVRAEDVKVCIAKIVQGPTSIEADAFRNVGIADCAAAIENTPLP